ncbi:MAG: hypothetical protein HY540_02280 [Deltaproteobacteria bacterium]|nr:hypothetical protein [Deltaproteobacteria bacterium]
MSVESLAGKLSTEAMSKLTEKVTPQSGDTPGSSFKDILQSTQDDGTDFAKMLNMDNTDASPMRQMNSLSANMVDYHPAQMPTGVGQPDFSRKIIHMLSDVNKSQQQMGSIVNHILYSGKHFSNSELLVIQAQMFEYAQTTEITVKLAEHSIGSVKSVMNTQVQ